MIFVEFNSQSVGGDRHHQQQQRKRANNDTALVSELERSDASKARVNLNRLPRFLFFSNGFQLAPASSDFCGGDLLGGMNRSVLSTELLCRVIALDDHCFATKATATGPFTWKACY